jgi:hypothetical protein
MMFKKSRLRLANWLSGGRILFDKEENKAMAIAGQYVGAGLNIVGSGGGSSGVYTLGPQESNNVYLNSDITLRITRANGGYIINVQTGPVSPQLYLIHEDADFDTELGKIITMSQLRK